MKSSALIFLALFAVTAPAETVVTSSGKLTGSVSGKSRVFLGIPYAKAPVGALRWRAPVPFESTLARKAQTPGTICPQLEIALSGEITSDEVLGQEDCLYLNVWTPSSSAQGLPVMVFIHGGGFINGSGIFPKAGTDFPLYDGRELSEKTGAIVVTFNYRLGALGFLAHPALSKEASSSGNFGLLDQIEALRWVKQNIKAFGGNPNLVTIFGESAGATSVCSLLASPPAAGLFQRAILESGPCTARTLSEQEKLGISLAKRIGCPSDLDSGCLRGKTPRALISDVAMFSEDMELHFQNVIDPNLLPLKPLEALRAGKYHRVPIIVGSNTGEIPASGLDDEEAALTEAQYREYLEQKYGEMNGEVLFTAYDPGKRGYRSVAAALAALKTDAGFTCQVRAVAEGVKASPVYVYSFSQPVLKAYLPWVSLLSRLKDSSTSVSIPDAPFHGAELFYVFGALDRLVEQALKDSNLKLPMSIGDRMTQAVMMNFWGNFAAQGAPALATRWPRYDVIRQPVQDLASTSETKLRFYAEKAKVCDILMK